MDAQFRQMETRHFLIQNLGKDIHTRFVTATFFPKIQLRERLIGKAAGHHKRRVAGGATQIDQSTFGQHENGSPVFQEILIDLRLHGDALDPFGAVEPVDLDFVIKVANVADDGLVLHGEHVLQRDHILVACGCHVDVGLAQGGFYGGDFETFQNGLKGIDRINLSDNHPGTKSAHGLSAAFAHITIAHHHDNFSCHHHIGGSFDAIGQRFAAAIEIVELGLGDRIVHIDGRYQEATFLLHLVETVHTGSGLLGNTLEFLDHFMPAVGVFLMHLLEEIFDDLFFVIARRGVHPIATFLQLITLVDEQGGVASIIDNELWPGAVGMTQRLVSAPPVFFQGFPFPGKDRVACLRNGGSGVVLSGKNIATCPTHGGSQICQGLNENRCLDRHVQRACDTNARQGFVGRMLLSDGHEAGHFLFCDADFLATPIGQCEIGYLVVLSGGYGFCRCLTHDGIDIKT